MAEYTLNININNNGSGKSKIEKAREELAKYVGKESAKTVSDDEVTSVLAKQKKSSANTNLFVRDMMAIAKQSVNIVASLPGTKYSDVALQNGINNAMSVVGKLTSAGTSIATGAAAGGWVGAIIAAVATVSTNALEMVYNNQQFQWKQHENTLNEVRNSERIGVLRSDRNR